MDNFRRRINDNKSIFDQNGRAIIDGREFVNLELPSGILWETCNVYAKTETEVGDYYKGKDLVNYDYYGGFGGKTIPNRVIIQELIDNTTHSVVTINGVKCIKLVSNQNPNAYMVVPFSGYKRMSNGSINDLKNISVFWSSENYQSGSSSYRYNFYGTSTNVRINEGNEEIIGYPVRCCVRI